MSDNSIPLKTCTKCGQSFPATTEYFYKCNSKEGLRSRCKACIYAEKLQWQAENPERHKATQRARHAREDVQEKKRQWLLDNPEYHRDYYQKNRDKLRARERQRKQDPTIKQRGAETTRRWAQENPDRVRKLSLMSRHRRLDRLANLPNDFTQANWDKCLAYWNDQCAYCGGQDYIEIEHVIPITSPDCPGTIASNIVPSCRACNRNKSTKGLLEWLNEKFPNQAQEILTRIQVYFDSL